ncbi:unnamed protein product [Closterium sp. NIES-65]|nr:unnamed protein product [Closterium sp. NIES-65]
MSRQRLVLGFPPVLPSLPPSLAPPCGPCIEGRLRTTPHSSSLCLTNEPFEALHLDVWGPAPRLGPEHEHFFLVVIDDYSRYTTVFPLAKKSEVRRTPAEPLATRVSATGFTDQSLDRVPWRCVKVSCLGLLGSCPRHFRAIPCIFLGFPEDSSDFTFYHPPSHRFFDSRDVRFEESTPYYVQPPPPGPAPSGVSQATPPPSVAPQVLSSSP